MRKVVFPSILRVKGIEFSYSEEEYEDYEVRNGCLCYFTRIYREAVPVKERKNIKRLASLLNELALEHQFSIPYRWCDWKETLYGSWSFQERDGELEISSHIHLRGSADLVHINIPIDGGDPICVFRYCDDGGLKYSQFNHDFYG